MTSMGILRTASHPPLVNPLGVARQLARTWLTIARVTATGSRACWASRTTARPARDREAGAAMAALGTAHPVLGGSRECHGRVTHAILIVPNSLTWTPGGRAENGAVPMEEGTRFECCERSRHSDVPPAVWKQRVESCTSKGLVPGMHWWQKAVHRCWAHRGRPLEGRRVDSAQAMPAV